MHFLPNLSKLGGLLEVLECASSSSLSLCFCCWATNLLFVSGIRYFDDFLAIYLVVVASFSA